MRRASCALLLSALTALTATTGCPPAVEVRSCVNQETLRVCVDDRCEERPCRGDALCVDDACVHWTTADLWADFDLVFASDRPELVEYLVYGGFPWRRARHQRLDFGDGEVGWGEQAFHRFEAPGVYPVRLEVELEGHRYLYASRLALVEPLPEDWNPLLLTVDDVPAQLNGSRPFTSDAGTPDDPADDYQEAFHLLVPRHGFDLEVWLLAPPEDPIASAGLTLTADVALGDGALPAGTDLAPRLRFDDDPRARAPHATWSVGADEAFPEGLVTLTLQGVSARGTRFSQQLVIEATELPPERDPFDRPSLWLLRFDMDLFSSTATHHDGGVIAIESVLGANGRADFAEELALVGAQGGESAAGAASVQGRGRVGANAVYLQWVKDEVVREVRRFYHMAPDGAPQGGIPIEIYADGDAGAPDPASFRPDGDFSMMRLGGALEDNFGRSWYSAFNEERVDDTAEWLGVGTARLIGLVSAAPVLTDQLLAIKPNTGTPVGDHALDAEVLAAGFDRYAPQNNPEANARYDALAWAAEVIGLTVASVTAHEMGHALGLVPDGPPPAGFFGGRPDVAFMGAELTDSHHADYPYLNLMQSGGNPFAIIGAALACVDMPRYYDTLEVFYALGHENRLSHYALAYLRRQLTYQAF